MAFTFRLLLVAKFPERPTCVNVVRPTCLIRTDYLQIWRAVDVTETAKSPRGLPSNYSILSEITVNGGRVLGVALTVCAFSRNRGQGWWYTRYWSGEVFRLKIDWWHVLKRFCELITYIQLVKLWYFRRRKKTKSWKKHPSKFKS